MHFNEPSLLKNLTTFVIFFFSRRWKREQQKTDLMHHHGHLAAHHGGHHPGYLHAGGPVGSPYGHTGGPGAAGLGNLAAANYLAGSLKSGQAAAAAAAAAQQAAFAQGGGGGTLEDRMRWAQMAEAMNQNVYAVSDSKDTE